MLRQSSTFEVSMTLKLIGADLMLVYSWSSMSGLYELRARYRPEDPGPFCPETLCSACENAKASLEKNRVTA